MILNPDRNSTRLSASIFSNTSELIGFVNGSGSIVGSNSILINGSFLELEVI